MSLYNNKLSTVPNNIFRNLVNLIDLHLADNFIENLSKETFNQNKNLKSLYLYNNKLKQLPADIFSELKI